MPALGVPDGRRVLVAEDEWFFQLETADALVAAGFVVECATTVAGALSLIAKFPFQAAVLDAWLGEWSIEVAEV